MFPYFYIVLFYRVNLIPNKLLISFDHDPVPLKIVAILAAMVFGLKGLPWEPLDHLEIFAGCMSVTRGEIQERDS